MDWFEPLQRESGVWDYTRTNSVGSFPIGYCAGYVDYTDPGVRERMSTLIGEGAWVQREMERMEAFKEKYHRDGHKTAEEAQQCYQRYLLDQHLTVDDGEKAVTQKKCGICGAWTSKSMVVNDSGYCKVLSLCDEHLTKENAEILLGRCYAGV